MEINQLAAIGYGLAALVFGFLAILLLGQWKDRPRSTLIALASGATAVWAAIQTVGSLGALNAPVVLLIIETVRSLAWLVALAAILRDLDEEGQAERQVFRYGSAIVAGFGLVASLFAFREVGLTIISAVLVGGVAAAALILVLTEQIYRNSPFDAAAGLKYFCVGLAGIYVYDLIIFTLMIVNGDLRVENWASRGFVTALFAIPIVLAARRSFKLTLDQYVPRQFLFYTFVLIGIGIFVSVALIGDYYIEAYGGEWGGVVRVILLAMAVLVVAVLLVSPTIRARVRVLLMKSFFQYKYDYRNEWLRFIGTLTESDLDNVSATAVRAVAQIVNSPAGMVWARDPDGEHYVPLGAWQCELPIAASISNRSSLVRFLRQRQWVIDLHEMEEHPGRYEDLELDDWLLEGEGWWLIVPLFLQKSLFGFMLLQKPRLVPSLNFEDHDLLRTVGRHVATHIDQAESDRRLAEASQFGAYNRLTAFLMHDLNNLIAQQSLVVKNAERFKDNPDFVDDAISTIANSVARMRRLMEQLTSQSELTALRETDLAETIDRAVRRCDATSPKPAFAAGGLSIQANADPERLVTVFEHLIRNAQDATDRDGVVEIKLSTEDSIVVIDISDNGCGMTPDFIRNRLFRPFDSTKGSQSMGIGAYQAREYVRQLGGQLEVTSVEGKGTTFRIRLPFVAHTV